MRCLSSLPPELLLHIFAFACTDDGSTGRVLSQVSRHIAATSAPVRYQSIALVGVDAICAFAAHLSSFPLSAESEGDADARKVRNLFVCQDSAWKERWLSFFDRRPPDGVVHDVWSALGPRKMRRIESTSDIGERKGIIDAHMGEVRRMREALRAILSAVSPHLRILTLFCTTPQFTFGPLPCLEDLTVQALDHCEWRQIGIEKQQFPALRRLHITKARNKSAQPHLIAALAPALTHLRLSGVLNDVDIGQRFAAALGVAIPNLEPPSVAQTDVAAEAKPPPPPLLRSIRKLMICAAVAKETTPEGPWQADALLERDQRMFDSLSRLAEMDPRVQLHVVVRATDEPSIVSHEYVAKDWQDTICGGEGPFGSVPGPDHIASSQDVPRWAWKGQVPVPPMPDSAWESSSASATFGSTDSVLAELPPYPVRPENRLLA